MKNTIFLLLFLLGIVYGFDSEKLDNCEKCSVEFMFKGNIYTKEIKIIEVWIPSIEFLLGQKKFESNQGHEILKVIDGEFNHRVLSNPSRKLCNGGNEIVNLINRKVKSFPIRIYRDIKGSSRNLIQSYYSIDLPVEFLRVNVSESQGIIIDISDVSLPH